MAWDTGLDINSAAYNFATSNSKTLRVIAGPGTGKTFGLQRRIARLLENGQNSKRILAVTFTRTAAQDLKKGIHDTEVDGAEQVVAKTLHSFCFSLLNKREIIKKTGRIPRPLLEFELKPLLYDIDKSFGNVRSKRKLLSSFEAAWAVLQSDIPGFPPNNLEKQFCEEIHNWLKEHRAMLFGEMIIETYHYLRNNPHCAELTAFDYILVDEYQDLNKAEQAVIDLLSTNCELTIIGDDDQSIYSFKHAHTEGIREFPLTHFGCENVEFDECRRCPQKVVDLAAELISRNKNRTLGALRKFEKNQAGQVDIVQWKTLENEISGICHKIAQDIKDEQIKPEDVLILTPVRKIGYRVRDCLVMNSIAAKSYFRESVLATDETKYTFSLISLLANPEDIASLRFLLGYGSNEFCAKSYKRILDYSRQNDLSIIDVLKELSNGNIKIEYASALIKKYNLICSQLNQLTIDLETHPNFYVDILTKGLGECGEFRDLLAEAIDNTTVGQLTSVQERLHQVHLYLVEKISFPENTTEPDHVRIMSLHASKGLSAKYVVVMSMIDELLPRIEKDSIASIDKQIEEQRRLFYVAITRCKGSTNANEYPGKLIISSFTQLPGSDAISINIPADPMRPKFVSASRFVTELGKDAPSTLTVL